MRSVSSPPVRGRGGSDAALAVLSVAQFLIAVDFSIVYVALPGIARDLGLGPAAAQWVVSAFAVFFAGFLLVGGRLADRVGGRPLFVAAVCVFGGASVLGGLAQEGVALLAARAAQGVGAALLQPAVLALLGSRFAAGAERGRALAVWGAVGAAGLAAGVVLGGVLGSLSWRLTFWVNVPLVLVCAAGGLAWFGRDGGDREARVPLLASVLGTGAVLAVVAALSAGAEDGGVGGGYVPAALVLVAAFVAHEARGRRALVDRELRRTGSLRLGAVATALYMASVGSEFYLVTLSLQSLRGFSALAAGLAFLPLAAIVTVGNVVAGRLVRGVHAGVVLAGGFALAAAGLGWLAVAGGSGSYAAGMLGGLLVSGFAHGVIYTAMFVIGTRDVAAARQGTAGAVLTTSQYVSSAVAVAVLTLVLQAVPGPAGFAAAFWVTAGAAAAGVAVGVAAWRRG
ncbi:putative MFS family arabinose efflux permease [Thermocatellispora tengchongensis]|uniref:Putative MFS family arabinose efflux permease n=1 Tax=Thermocatellispora tengchongensis TaxID=1073253 RepID=A0A840PCT6_9ACTN|nr:MFS transporter [Thermocatellispora tengchongensis]MBB5137052.1 putative MFS family arabinose efflux permease [Thermocatellispora tengchongensis]